MVAPLISENYYGNGNLVVLASFQTEVIAVLKFHKGFFFCSSLSSAAFDTVATKGDLDQNVLVKRPAEILSYKQEQGFDNFFFFAFMLFKEKETIKCLRLCFH